MGDLYDLDTHYCIDPDNCKMTTRQEGAQMNKEELAKWNAYLKAERERMEAAMFFCRVCHNWEMKESHPHYKEPKSDKKSNSQKPPRCPNCGGLHPRDRMNRRQPLCECPRPKEEAK